MKNDEVQLPAQKASSNDIYTDDEALIAAQKAFGITYLYPWQRIVIANILDAQIPSKEKEDLGDSDDTEIYKGKQIVLLPTGAGKSLCFLTPSLLLEGATIVLYPLLALMSDQKRRMDEGGIKSVVFSGGQTEEQREENFREIENGAKIILANPEVLQSERLVDRLANCKISHIAIDEAHCCAEWGDTFRPAYLNLGKVIEKINAPAITAFTATASPQVLSRVSEILFGGMCHVVRSDSDRPNIHYEVINAYAKKRTAFLLALQRPKPLIIFCGTRNKSEDMARELAAYCGSDKVKFYHAGMTREEKDKVEKWFYPKTDAILCCTCAFGMGVDKKDIHTVIHLEPSPTAEAYIQEAGRGGRDGSIADAVLLWSPNDSRNSEKFPKGSRERVLKEFAESTTCRRQVLLDALGGEQAACQGCDICKRGNPAPMAEDGKFVLNLVAKNKKKWTLHDLNFHSAEMLNKKIAATHKRNFYEHSDTDEIITQLKNQNLIRECNFPFKGLVTTVRKGSES
ncbi:RecQ family ATP-dependent DNA helicase [Treponema sp.]|uniref:RecQ family ATP-dependent DNA helicase n=1 Tax=Treponema sp. TaxID=166 RepID=UPI00298E5C10|nr:RecQ family ATP-dependent DNA helicase [Treponema sp.]MCQ2241414.1 RecQ family ATP-dependent DNA helicase [Treponema sp.]